MKYFIYYRISEPDASRFGVKPHEAILTQHSFKTVEEAIQCIREIKDDPNHFLSGAWMAFAYFWIADTDGNIRWN